MDTKHKKFCILLQSEQKGSIEIQSIRTIITYGKVGDTHPDPDMKSKDRLKVFIFS